MVVVNKWDTIQAKTDKSLREYEDNVRAEVRRGVPDSAVHPPPAWATVLSRVQRGLAH